MLPDKNTYPHFVPDQLLTSENLNNLFGYLDEQGRLTRTNLIGIGIVCGLEVKPSQNGKTLTITKGTGITSEGHLISIPETTYTQYKIYDPDQEKTYDKFLNPADQKFWELFQTASAKGTTPLSYDFLNGNGLAAKKKVVLLFVELLEIDNKNCNPNSCDDKGVRVEVNIRPLLVEKSKTEHLLNGSIGTLPSQQLIGLKNLNIKRFDVPNTSVATTSDVFNAFLRHLNKSFIEDIELTFSHFWTLFKPVLDEEFQTANPFSGLTNVYKKVYEKNLEFDQFLHVQYYYDFVCDLINAYNELRETGLEVLTVCTPPSHLFPRHLMLDLALPVTSELNSAYRHYFVGSPLFQHHQLHVKLKSLFRRLVLLIKNFAVPPIQGNQMKQVDPYQRITPSRLGPDPLSHKAIPYYYKVKQGERPLYKEWDIEKTLIGQASQNLSYHANQYAGPVNALEHDLEPYNFLRVEGIVGKSYTKVLRDLKSNIQKHRLAVDVVAINTDTSEAQKRSVMDEFSMEELTENMGDLHCYFNDLDAMYSALRNEILCVLCQELRYYYDIPLQLANLQMKAYTRFLAKLSEASDKDLESVVPLFGYCTKTPYQINRASLGTVIEEIYRKLEDKESLSSAMMLKALDVDSNIEEVSKGGQQTNTYLTTQLSAAVSQMVPILEIPLFIIRLSELLTEELHDFDVDAFCKLHEQVAKRARSFKKVNTQVQNTEKESIRKQLYQTQKQVNVESVKAAKESAKSAKGIEKVSDAIASKQITDTDLELFEIKQKAYISNQIKSEVAQAKAEQMLVKEDLQVVATTQTNIGAILLFLFIVEDLYDHLDTLIYSCKCNVLKGLKLEYLRRAEELLDLRQLQNFSKRHPGLEHKAGVPKGGTFILVYHTPEDQRDRFWSKNNPNKAIVFKKQLKLQELIEQIPEGTVIADFYLPYLCYSNCPPIVFNIKEVEELPVIVSLNLQANALTGTLAYDVGDESTYNFSHTPQEGTLNNGTEENGVKMPSPNDYIFVPTLLAEKIGNEASLALNFSFTSQGQTSDPIAVTVYNTPTADILVTPNQTTVPVGTTLKFEGVLKYADKASWYLKTEEGTSVISNEISLGERVFEKPGTYVFSLIATQSATQASSEPAIITIVVANEPGAVLTSEPEIKEKTHFPVGQILQFKAELTNADKVEWYENGTQFSDKPQIPPKEYKEPGNYSVKVKVVQSETSQSAFSNELSFSVVGSVTAKIKTNPEVSPEKPIQPGTIITFNGITENADTYRWTRNNTFVSSSKEDVKIQFEKQGLEVIKFEATNSRTGDSGSDSLNILVGKEVVTTCQKCAQVAEAYKKLNTLDKDNYNSFKKWYLDEWQIHPLMNKLAKVCDQPLDKQIAFYQGIRNDTILPLETAMPNWLNFIHQQLTNEENAGQHRLLFLELYRILSGLTMHVACMQNEDIDKAAIKTIKVFRILNDQLKGRNGLWALRKTKLKAESQPLEQLKVDVAEEEQRLKASDEQTKKPKYANNLKKLLVTMK